MNFNPVSNISHANYPNLQGIIPNPMQGMNPDFQQHLLATYGQEQPLAPVPTRMPPIRPPEGGWPGQPKPPAFLGPPIQAGAETGQGMLNPATGWNNWSGDRDQQQNGQGSNASVGLGTTGRTFGDRSISFPLNGPPITAWRNPQEQQGQFGDRQGNFNQQQGQQGQSPWGNIGQQYGTGGGLQLPPQQQLSGRMYYQGRAGGDQQGQWPR